MNYPSRRDRLRKLIKKSGAKSLLVTNFANVTYLTGFTGDDSFLLITPTNEIFLTDPRYTEQVEAECPGLELCMRRPGITMTDIVGKTSKRAKISELAIEGDSMTVSARSYRQQVAESRVANDDRPRRTTSRDQGPRRIERNSRGNPLCGGRLSPALHLDPPRPNGKGGC